MRLAYEQLDELAANAERVKFAIERNRSLLTLQVVLPTADHTIWGSLNACDFH